MGMNGRNRFKVATTSLGVILTTTGVFAQTQPPTQGPAEDGTPAWFLQGSFPDPGGNTAVHADGRVTIPPRARGGVGPTAATEASLPRTPGLHSRAHLR